MPAKAPTLDPTLAKLLARDKRRLEAADVPIVTVSASFKEDLKGWYGLPENEELPDVVFSRAHYTMAVAVATQAWGKKMNPAKAWIIDPTNYVEPEDWSKIEFTEFVGKTLARQPVLKKFKDFIDKWGRNKLPILSSIEPSLLYLTQDISKPILSLHIAAGNILAEAGKTVIQVVTDPHVRADYLNNADRSNMLFCVFDHKTKMEFLEKAITLKKPINPERIIVAGPPIDPRILEVRRKKQVWKNPKQSGPLKLCLTTGGLGTNKNEIKTALHQLLPVLGSGQPPLQIMVYASTQKDIHDLCLELAEKYQVRVGNVTETHAPLRVLYHPQIVDANELLMKYGFPWADGFITKPSGDMAYDAAGAGCFLLTLKEWGEWETNIKNFFAYHDISREALLDDLVYQLDTLIDYTDGQTTWVTRAQQATRHLPSTFYCGTYTIVSQMKKLSRK